MLTTAYLLVLILPIVQSCLPGYESERDKLREHLGIEWVPNGLDTNAFSNKPVRHTSELDCNFANVTQCKWKNMAAEMYMDSIDFYLFEKIDFTEFPALRVGPGPTKVAQGEKMMFTGDKKREEQHAIYYSSPIGCQNSTGRLTFTYWVYNSARVEVVLLEDQPDGTYKTIYEKPYVDCGTVQLNTECHAEIPPRSTPFRIGIRAYEMATKEGSFVLIDNILYSASLCNVGVDLGDDFTYSPLESSAEGKSIVKSSDLDCAEFNKQCRWRDGGKTSKHWKMSSSRLPREFIFNVTGNYIGPDGAYAILYVEQNTIAPIDVLRSDPIACQTQTENALSFRFWKTQGVEIEVCAVDMMGSQIECLPVPSAVSPAIVNLSFRNAAKNFMITIGMSSMKDDADNVLIIDDITYKATLCSDALSVFDLGDNFLTTPPLSLLLNRHINSAQELSCDFSRRAADCVWGSTESNPAEDSEIASSQWLIGHGPLNGEKFYSLTGLSNMPEGEFAVAKLETGGSTILLSEVVRCVIKDVSIQLNLWLTGTATLQICLVEETSPSLLDCQPASSGPVVIDLPPIDRPFRIALRASAADQGMVIVDNIQVQGEVCPSVVRQYSSKQFRPLAEQPDPNVCRLLSCDFSKGHACLYDSSPVPNTAKHEVYNKAVISHLDRLHNVSILESPLFHLNAVSRLHFQFQVQGDVTLFVCNDSANKELESCFKVEGKEGDDFIEMLPSDTKVYLIARLSEGGSSGTVTINKLQLTDIADNNAC